MACWKYKRKLPLKTEKEKDKMLEKVVIEPN